MTDLHSEKAAGAAAPNPQPSPQTPPKPAAKRPPRQEQEKPVRRVGSVTLGLCLMAVGVCFLCYYFVPGFDWLLVVKVGAPLALVALGVETLWCAARPGRWKYDFLAVFGCLVLMGGAFCLTLVPLFWQAVDPAQRRQLDALTTQYEDDLYEELRDEVQLSAIDIYADTNFGTDAPDTLRGLNDSGVRLRMDVELYGPYDRGSSGDKNVRQFAADCYTVLEAVRAEGVLPDRINFSWRRPDDTVGYELTLYGRPQMDWTAEQIAEQTRVWVDDDSTYSGSVYSGVDGSDDEAAPEAPSAPESPDAVPAVPEEADVPEAPETVSAKPVAVAPVIQMRMF